MMCGGEKGRKDRERTGNIQEQAQEDLEEGKGRMFSTVSAEPMERLHTVPEAKEETHHQRYDSEGNVIGDGGDGGSYGIRGHELDDDGSEEGSSEATETFEV